MTIALDRSGERPVDDLAGGETGHGANGASLVVTAVGGERSLRAWDPLTGAQVGENAPGHRRDPGRGLMLVSACDVEIYRVDLTTRTAVEPGPIDEDQDGWHDVTVVPLPDGRVIIPAVAGDVRRRHAETGESIGALWKALSSTTVILSWCAMATAGRC